MKTSVSLIVLVFSVILLGMSGVSSASAEETETTWPIYHELVIDESRGVIYASDPEGRKIDVISISNLTVVNNFTMTNFVPKGIALSPDDTVLAIANYGVNDIGNIVFLNPVTGAVIKKLIPNVEGSYRNKPWDLIYSDLGYLYTSGNPGGGYDFIHVIDTSNYKEIGKSTETIHYAPYLSISPDSSCLYVNESGVIINRYEITSGGLLSNLMTTGHSDYLKGEQFLVSQDETSIFMDSGQVWHTNLHGQIGNTGQPGNLTLLPTHNIIAIAIDNSYGNDAVAFYNSKNYYGIKKYALSDLGTLGPMIALKDESKLFVTGSAGIQELNLASGIPGTAIPRPASRLPYYDLIIDEARGVLYGSNSNAHKIDVIRLSDLQVIKSYRLPNGTFPKGIDLSPDGSELAIAEYGGSSIVFLNPDDGQILATVMPENNTLNMPWDVAYGKSGRLYSTGSPNYDGHYSQGFDYIHVIDTNSHLEIGKSAEIIRYFPRLVLSPDKNSLYVNDDANLLYKYDITTDELSNPVRLPSSFFAANNFLLTSDASKIFTDSGQVWDENLKGQIGATGQDGNVVELTAHGVIAVGVDNADNDAVMFFSVKDYYGIKNLALPALGKLGPMITNADGGQLFISHSKGIYKVDIAGDLPGTSIPLPVGSRPYFDMELDETRGVLYGSDSAGHKIDVISVETLKIVKRFRLVNGAFPKGIELSPDGRELAVAEFGASNITFLDLDTGKVIAQVIPVSGYEIFPWDVAYGRAGRLYSTGNPYSYGMDFLHVIDTYTHTDITTISEDAEVIRAFPTLAVSPDGGSVYVNEVWSQSELKKYDITTDIPIKIASTETKNSHHSTQFALSSDGSLLFLNDDQVWDSNLKAKIGSTQQPGRVISLPSLDAIAVLQDYSNGEVISFYDTKNYYGITSYNLPSLGKLGPMEASADGGKVFISSSKGISVIDLSLGFPGSPIPLPRGSQPYADLVLDEHRGVMYGSDSAGHKIDVISMSTLKVIKRFRLVNGASPRGIALSPDGTELAVAEFGASSIVFLNPENGKMLASVIPDTQWGNVPWDVIYGRPGRLYSSGSPDSHGLDYIHVFDTTSHVEVGKSEYKIRFHPSLAINSDGNLLYVLEGFDIGNRLFKFNVSSDVIPNPYLRDMNTLNYSEDPTILLKKDQKKIFTSIGQVWNASLTKRLGKFTPKGQLAEIPSKNSFLSARDGAIIYFNSNTFDQIGSAILAGVTKSGPIVVKLDDSVLFISTNIGIKSVDLTIFPPELTYYSFPMHLSATWRGTRPPGYYNFGSFSDFMLNSLGLMSD